MLRVRIATWNVNSVRARAERVTAWLERHDVDVLLVQETKCSPEKFPTATFTDVGYEVAHNGLNQWNGVAILSRVGLDDVQHGLPDAPGFGPDDVVEPRAVAATCAGLRLWSLYVPNGRAQDDPHYAYKLEWLRVAADVTRSHQGEHPDQPFALCGDFNVAPQDDDVWDTEFFADKTHTTGPERAAFDGLLDAGLTDVVRPHAPGPGVYTFWDYTQLRFPKKQGMRIDFVLGNDVFAEQVDRGWIDRDERKGKGASDHAPVVVDLTT